MRVYAQPIRNRDRACHQRGLALIEVLVALLILSIGLLGLAALQLTSVQMTTQSQQKSQAILLAQDAIERVRANRNNGGDYGMTVDNSANCDTGFTPPPGSSVREQDQAEWQNAVRCLLADGGGTLTIENNPNRVVVNVTWETRRDEDQDAGNDSGRLVMTGHF